MLRAGSSGHRSAERSTELTPKAHDEAPLPEGEGTGVRAAPIVHGAHFWFAWAAANLRGTEVGLTALRRVCHTQVATRPERRGLVREEESNANLSDR